MIYPLVGDLAVDGIPVTVTCRVLGFSPQAYYKWRANPVSQRDWDDAHLINAAWDIHHDDPAFGYRFIADELPAHGITAGANRVARLRSQQRIFSVFAKRKGLARRTGPPVHDDLLRRQFTAAAPDRVWLTDITEHRTGEGKLYLCAIKDACSGRIVGYSIDSRMKASLAVAALRNAIRLRNPAGTIVHSDRGSQFRSRKFVKVLHRNGLVGSMGRVGGVRRQRRDGVVLRPATEQRPRPATLGHTPAAAPGDRHLDRTHLPPPTPPTTTRPTHTGRV